MTVVDPAHQRVDASASLAIFWRKIDAILRQKVS
jgi:hypothetical protein